MELALFLALFLPDPLVKGLFCSCTCPAAPHVWSHLHFATNTDAVDWLNSPIVSETLHQLV